jgi:hypothetical protein
VPHLLELPLLLCLLEKNLLAISRQVFLEWKNNADNMELQSETGSIALVYAAKSVNMVAGGTGEVTISEDESTLVGKYRGVDLSEWGKFTTDGQRLYNLSIRDIMGHIPCA